MISLGWVVRINEGWNASFDKTVFLSLGAFPKHLNVDFENTFEGLIGQTTAKSALQYSHLNIAQLIVPVSTTWLTTE